MGFDFTGRVLEAPRTSPTNTVGTGEPVSGVVRSLQPPPSAYFFKGVDAPVFVEPWADQYRTAVLLGPGTTTVEYLVWAANTAQLATLDGWWTEEGTGSIPTGGTLIVLDARAGYPPWEDGTNRIIVTDNGNRDIGTIQYVVIARGDKEYEDEGWTDPDNPSAGRNGDAPYEWFAITTNQDAAAGVVRLLTTDLPGLGGGLSPKRGDAVVEVRYTVAAPRFWWTRNDRYATRFGWNGKTQKWEPYRGSAPKDMGRLQIGQTYTLDPRPRGLVIGRPLPGDGALTDAYAMLRLGDAPGAGSTPVGPNDPDGFAGVRVLADSEVAGYTFATAPDLAGVVGRTNGLLVFNPAYAALHAGEVLWYGFRDFQKDATGTVGPLFGSDISPLFIAPIPGPTDYPFIRLGSRRPLLARLVDTDAALEAASPDPGEVYISLSTGRLRLAQYDISRADPDSTNFDKQFLGETVYYDGVALNQMPQMPKAPVPLVSVGDDLFIPAAVTLPDEFTSPSNERRGLGVSGVLDLPDGTGALPVEPTVPAALRPGGDNDSDPATGRIRQVNDGVGDLILFSLKGAITTLNVVDLNSDLPSKYDVDGGQAFVARQATNLGGGVWGSKVIVNSDDLDKYGTDPIYFLQATLTPATYTTKARLISRNSEPFRFAGGEDFRYEIDGTLHDWAFSGVAGQAYSAAEMAAMLPAGATALNGHVVLSSATPDSPLGHVEIAFGLPDVPFGPVVKNFTGAAVLGFLPGWRAVGSVPVWLPDSGVALGLYRNALNLDRSQGTADYNALSRVTNAVIQQAVLPNPFVFLDQPPLQDIAGYDEGVFFQFTSSAATNEADAVPATPVPLENYVDVRYRFGDRKFEWLGSNTVSEFLPQPVNALNLLGSNIVPESMLGAPGIGGGLWVAADGQAAVSAEQGVDYVLPNDGAIGAAILIERFGRRVAFGSKGQMVGGTGLFIDTSADFSAVTPGYRLKILSGEAAGSYTVAADGAPTAVVVTPNFLTSGTTVAWEMYAGISEADYDPGLVADKVYKEFNHLPSEPFRVRVLAPLGLVPADAAAQSASRLRADMAGALRSGRSISLRFEFAAQTSVNSATLVGLGQTKLGIIANNRLDLPDTLSSVRFAGANFRIRIGATSFSAVGVGAFSPDPGGGSGIEYLLATTSEGPKGRLKFGTSLLRDFSSAAVACVDTFLAPANLASTVAEYDPNTGDLNLSAATMATFAGHSAYFVEQMVTEDKKDVSIAPLSGTFAFSEPIKKNQIVEVEYWAATDDGHRTGDMIQEFLPVFVRNENATRVTATEYRFNADGRIIDERIDPTVYIGPIQQNFGSNSDCSFGYPDTLAHGDVKTGRIIFFRSMADYVQPTVTYAAFNALGGETVYESSTKPVYRPPFFIEAGTNRIGVRGDRTGDILPGQLLRVGEACFYIKKTEYFPPHMGVYTDPLGNQTPMLRGDVTGIDIFPGTVQEAGSRAPGNDLVNVITKDLIALVVDPKGQTPVVTTAAPGFWETLDLTTHPFEPVARGQSVIIFLGDMTASAVPGHLFEADGVPFTVTQSELSVDGRRTKVSLSMPFPASTSVADKPILRFSRRPVYPPGAAEFLGVGPIYANEPVELVLYGETDGAGNAMPGRTLTPTANCTVEADTGRVTLLGPEQQPLVAGQRLGLSFTRLRVLSPFVADGAVLYPRYSASYLFVTTPSSANGLKDGLLMGTYTFSNPDAYYWRIPTVAAFLGEIAQQAQQDISAKQPAGGASRSTGGGTENWKQGRTGLKAERRHLTDTDMAARRFLGFYSEVINAFEQVPETISGGFVGDRDGKFRFFVGRGKDYPPPGYEDAITGLLNPRNIWASVFTALDQTHDIHAIEADPLVEPQSATLVDGEVDGSFPGASSLHGLIKKQARLVQNDVDDVVLLGVSRTETSLGGFIWFSVKAWGHFDRLAEPSFLSRIYPRTTRAFFTTYPGINADPASGDPGVYAWKRYTWAWDWDSGLSLSSASTTRTTIGKLSNPVLGEITNVRDGALTKRCARGRVWGYFPDGLPAGAFQTGGFPSAPIDEPCIIVTPAMLRDFPVNPETGYPDQTMLLSQGGVIPDAAAGDPELAVPGFKAGDQVAWGKPNGRTFAGYYLEPVTIFGQSSLTGLFVRDVQYGCVIRFQSSDGTAITDPTKILVGNATDGGIPAHSDAPPLCPIRWGDTLYAGPPVGVTAEPANDTPTEKAANIGASDSYSTGFDLRLKENGEVEDLSRPSIYDPFFIPIKEWSGQHTADPLACMEGTIEFVYDKQNPLGIPALSGEERDDSGDFQIPYMASSNTELERLGQAAVGGTKVMEVVDYLGNYVYPDEIRGEDGEVVTAVSPWVGARYKEPATFLTASNLLPAGGGTPPLGEGDVRPYDLMFVEVEDGSPVPPGMQGILSVGRFATLPDGLGGTCNYIEPPRFVTPTTAPTGASSATGSPVCYTFENAVAYVSPPPEPTFPVGLPPFPDDPPGVRLRYNPAGLGLSVLDFGGVAPFVLNDGTTAPGGVGNYNSILAASANNHITIRLYARQDLGITTGPPPGPLPVAGQPVLTVHFFQGTAWTEDCCVPPNVYPLVPLAVVPTFGVKEILGPEPVEARREVHVVGNLFPFGPGGTPLQQRQWFLPHATDGMTGVITSLYSYDFTISVDTYNVVGVEGQSDTAYISDDRLTFNEVIDLRHAKQRGFNHPVSGLPMDGRLAVHEVTCVKDGNPCFSRVNRGANGWLGLNDPDPFTFVARSIVTTSPADYFMGDCGGTWVNAVALTSPERGTIRVMGMEGHHNLPISTSDVPFTVAPSDPFIPWPSGLPPFPVNICVGTGRCEGWLDFGNLYNSRITEVSLTAISGEGFVEPGDIAVITASADPAHVATTKAGTYIVRHAIQPTRPITDLYKGVTPTTGAGAGSGWAPFTFPTSLGVVPGAPGQVNLRVTDSSPTALAMFPASGRVYVIRDAAGLNSGTDPTNPVIKQAIISAAYASVAVISGHVEFVNLTFFRDAMNNALTASAFTTLVGTSPYPISGMTRLPVRMAASGLPDNNVVGYDDPPPGADISCYGFHWMTLTGPGSAAPGAPLAVGTAGAPSPDLIQFVRGAPVNPNEIGVFTDPVEGVSGGLYIYVPDPRATVYENVPAALDISLLAPAKWRALNLTWAPPASEVSCLLPGTIMALDTGGGNPWGFFAQAGIFLEPSVPHSAFDLSTAYPHVVDHHDDGSEHDLPVWETGMRSFSFYQRPGDPAATTPEAVTFEIRRIRRFHDAQNGLDENLAPLRFAYEIRRGKITAFSRLNYLAVDKQAGIIEADTFLWDDGKTYTGTTLGPFSSPDVNIHPGDRFRVLDALGEVYDEAEIAGFVFSDPYTVDGAKLRLAAPGLTKSANPADYVGMHFEVWLRQAPVPHEQTNEQLLDLITYKKVTRTDADRTDPDPTNWVGGYVPEIPLGGPYDTVVNRLYDDKDTSTFTARGVKKGDIVLVDPAGLLPTGERGVYPIGDTGVAPRAAVWPDAYAVGRPDPVDDNRGFYRVTKIVPAAGGDPAHLEVAGASEFAGDSVSGNDVLFPTNATYQGTWGYALYPTVHDSALPPDNIEGQADLRPTKYADPVFGYTSNRYYSVRPFSYRVIRPSRLFSTKAVDLVLLMRERMLSLIQMFRVAMLGQKHGSYFVFQRDHHAHELERLNDPETGLGVLSNPFIERLVGQMMTMPFGNNGACLSILDRRFWILDRRLDSLTGKTVVSSRRMPAAESDTAQGGAPPDLITLALTANAADDYYLGWSIEITAGPGVGQTRRVIAYTGATQVAQVFPVWGAVPDMTSTYTATPVPYTALTDTVNGGGKVRPLLPDRIQTILNTVDRFRPLRSTWLAYRVHRVLGTLAAIKAFDEALPERLAEAQRALMIQESTEKSDA